MIISHPKTSFLGVVFDVDHDSFEGPRGPKANLDTVLTKPVTPPGHPLYFNIVGEWSEAQAACRARSGAAGSKYASCKKRVTLTGFVCTLRVCRAATRMPAVPARYKISQLPLDSFHESSNSNCVAAPLTPACAAAPVRSPSRPTSGRLAFLPEDPGQVLLDRGLHLGSEVLQP